MNNRPKINHRPGQCLYCSTSVPAGEGFLTWCEDGSPIFCPQHFDVGGWEVVCAHVDACNERVELARKEEEARRAREARAESERQEREQQAKFDRVVAEHTAGMSPTEFGPYDWWELSRFELVAEVTWAGERKSWEARLYRATDGYVTTINGTRCSIYRRLAFYGTAGRIEQVYRDWAAECGITGVQAREALADRCVNGEATNMYLAVIPECERLAAIRDALAAVNEAEAAFKGPSYLLSTKKREELIQAESVALAKLSTDGAV